MGLSSRALDAAANHSDLDDAHVAVTNIQQLAEGGRWLDEFEESFFDLIIVDEGHHNVAPTWLRVFDKFPDAKVISLTATPFRADDQPIEGEVIYRYPIADAMRRGFIKHIQASNVAPSELVFSYRGDSRRHTLDEVLRLKDKDWFSRGVALSEPCNVSIVDASIEWLRHLRQSGTHHQIVASACSIDHARAIRHLYEERGYKASEIHSNMARGREDPHPQRPAHPGAGRYRPSLNAGRRLRPPPAVSRRSLPALSIIESLHSVRWSSDACQPTKLSWPC
jgi:superfamily II DNA or RNA helicase